MIRKCKSMWVVLYAVSLILMVLSLAICNEVRMSYRTTNIFIGKDGPNGLLPLGFGIGILLLLTPILFYFQSTEPRIKTLNTYRWTQISAIYSAILFFVSFQTLTAWL